MMLYETIQHLYPAAVVRHDYSLMDNGDGLGPRIDAWNLPQPRPTPEQLAAAWATIAPSVAWDAARAERNVRLTEHDAHMAKALRGLRRATAAGDTKAMDTASATIVALDAYGQALADVTKGVDPANPVWPTRPW
jgi:hypothetical protein